MERDSAYPASMPLGMGKNESAVPQGLWEAILADAKLRTQLIRELEMDSINTVSFSDLGSRNDEEEVSKENFVDF